MRAKFSFDRGEDISGALRKSAKEFILGSYTKKALHRLSRWVVREAGATGLVDSVFLEETPAPYGGLQRRRHITVRLGDPEFYPLRCNHDRGPGFPRYVMADPLEAFVEVLAHECSHAKQIASRTAWRVTKADFKLSEKDFEKLVENGDARKEAEELEAERLGYRILRKFRADRKRLGFGSKPTVTEQALRKAACTFVSEISAAYDF